MQHESKKVNEVRIQNKATKFHNSSKNIVLELIFHTLHMNEWHASDQIPYQVVSIL